MQAYLVSKRPPRALYLAVAIALGMVAVSAAVLPHLGGGLMRDGTYLRLLGYAPSNRGASLTALSATDASQGRAVMSASSAPGPTPAPPAAQVASRSPSEAPANSSTAPASQSDRNPNPVGTDVPALADLNATRDDLANASLESFGFGVLPRDADKVRGAPDVMHFLAPAANESGCTWTQEVTATDANHDGHPEYVHVRQLGTCTVDANNDGKPEAGWTIARDFQVWDNDSNGKFNALEGRQGIEAFAEPNEDGVHAYTARAVWTVSLKDANEDKKPESLMATFAGEQRFDRNESGNAEFVRTVRAEICMVDDTSSGVPNSADLELHVYQTYDIGDNGSAEYRAALDLAASTRDANHDGHNESATFNVSAYEALDRNLDGRDELARGLSVSYDATDANSTGHPERIVARIYLYGRADPNSDGIPEVRKALEVNALARDANNDGHPELVRFNVTGAVVRDGLEPGRQPGVPREHRRRLRSNRCKLEWILREGDVDPARGGLDRPQ